MDALSNTNDLLVSLPGVLPLLLAAAIAFVLLRSRPWNALGSLRCSNLLAGSLVAGASVLLAIVMAFLQPTMSWGGADAYFARAVNLVEHGVFGTGVEPSALFPPGYSFVLVPLGWLLDGSRWAFFLTNLSLLLAAALFVRWALVRLGYQEGPANLVSLLLVLYPNRLLSTLLPFSDVPFSLLFLGAFLAMVLARQSPDRTGLLVLAGVLAGAAALVRSAGLVLLVPLAAGLLLPGVGVPGRRWIRAAGVLAIACAVLAPWTVRNSMLFDRLVPVSNNGGLNLAVGNNLTEPVARNSYVDSVWGEPQAWAAVGGEHWNEAQRDSFLARLGLRYMRENPLVTIGLGIRRVLFTMASDTYSFGALVTYTNFRTGVFEMTGDGRGETLRILARNAWVGLLHALFVLNNTVYYLLLILACYALARRGAGLRPVRTVALLTVGLVWLLVFVTFGMSRYKEPISAILPAVVVLLLVSPVSSSAARSPGASPEERETS